VPAAASPGWGPHAPYLAIGAAVVVGLVVVLALARLALRRRETRRAAPLAAPGAVAEESAAADPAALEHVRHTVQTLLNTVRAMVQQLLAENTSYDHRIEGHKGAIQRATTIAEIREVERLILHELDELQRTNAAYRTRLDEANAVIQRQQEDLDRTRRDAARDPLTRIGNRRALDDRLAEEVDRAARYGTVFSLILFDVDHFKRVNDDHGHLAGDRLLQAIAGLVSQQLRPSDFIARYGGEEFAIVLPETPAEKALLVAEKARRAVESMVLQHKDTRIRVSISAGFAEVRPGEESGGELLDRADTALYKAKENGRNRVERATS
jgi:diguanylate cyclase